ncbi:MAG: hypothetical protein ACRC6T_05005 [Sarcina sp.]
MNLKKLIIFLLCVYIINKILEFILKKSEKVKEKSKRKITMPALNALSIYSYEDFKNLGKDYLKTCDYKIIDEEGELILTKKDDEDYLVYCKQVKEYTDKLSNEDFYIFISEVKSRNIKKAIILTNGQLESNIKIKIDSGLRDIEMEYLESSNFVKELRIMKEAGLYKGEF